MLTLLTRVAVFDVVKTSSRVHPFVLLQPRLGLQDLLPNFDLVAAAKQDRLPNLESAYVGMVEETGSLFAMSPDRYPLVVFGDTNFEDDYRRVGRIDPPPGSMPFDSDRDFPPDVDSITRVMKHKKLKELCKNGSRDKRCLTGVRRLESSRLSRLLDGPPTVPYPPHMRDPRGGMAAEPRPNQSGALPSAGNASISPPGAVGRILESSSGAYFTDSAQALSTYAVGLVSFVVMLFWLFQKMDRRSSRLSSQASNNSTVTLVPNPAADIPKEDGTFTNTIASPATTETTLVEPSTPDAKSSDPESETPRGGGRTVSFGGVVEVTVATGVDEDENPDINGDADDSDADHAPTAGRRKPARRKRGKKKKGGAVNDGIAGNSEPPQTPQTEELPQTPKANEEPQVVHVVSPSSIVVPPPSTPVSVEPSLVVSDSILGKHVPPHLFSGCLIYPKALDPMEQLFSRVRYKAVL